MAVSAGVSSLSFIRNPFAVPLAVAFGVVGTAESEPWGVGRPHISPESREVLPLFAEGDSPAPIVLVPWMGGPSASALGVRPYPVSFMGAVLGAESVTGASFYYYFVPKTPTRDAIAAT